MRTSFHGESNANEAMAQHVNEHKYDDGALINYRPVKIRRTSCTSKYCISHYHSHYPDRTKNVCSHLMYSLHIRVHSCLYCSPRPNAATQSKQFNLNWICKCEMSAHFVGGVKFFAWTLVRAHDWQFIPFPRFFSHSVYNSRSTWKIRSTAKRQSFTKYGSTKWNEILYVFLSCVLSMKSDLEGASKFTPSHARN